VEEAEQLKRCMARHIYRHNLIDVELPSSVNARKKNTKAERRTWADWWREKHYEEYSDYTNGLKK
jgi:hypothetical protein